MFEPLKSRTYVTAIARLGSGIGRYSSVDIWMGGQIEVPHYLVKMQGSVIYVIDHDPTLYKAFYIRESTKFFWNFAVKRARRIG